MSNAHNKGFEAPTSSLQPVPSKQMAISRRAFVKGAAAVAGASVLAVSSTPLFGDDTQRLAWAADENVDTLAVAQESVFTTEDCEYIDDLESKLSVTAQMWSPSVVASRLVSPTSNLALPLRSIAARIR